MSIEILLISFAYFFALGLAFGGIYALRIVKKDKTFLIIFPLLTLLFMYLLYNINRGRVHIYFIAFFLLGIFISKVFVNLIKNKLIKLKIKRRR